MERIPKQAAGQHDREPRQLEQTTAGRGCKRERELFYAGAAGQLSPADERSLTLHEASCPGCAAEFSEWRRLRSALQNSRVAPGPGFTAAVMARVKEVQAAPERTAAWSFFWHQGWVRFAAAAAIMLALLGGALKLPATNSLIAQLHQKPGETIALVPPAPNGPSQPGAGSSNTGGQTATVSPGKTSSRTGGAASVNQTTATSPPVQTPPTISKPPGSELLNRSRVITVVTIKVNVSDLGQARNSALEIADSLGAILSSEQSAQNDGHSNLFLRFTVDPGMGGQLQDQLSALGNVVQNDKESQDVTAQYTSSLNALESLQAQQAAAPESDQQQYANQIEALQLQLQIWNNDTGKQVVVLWLVQ